MNNVNKRNFLYLIDSMNYTWEQKCWENIQKGVGTKVPSTVQVGKFSFRNPRVKNA
jgi:hypothetical protein